MLALLNRYSVLLIFPAVALAFFIGALFYYYRGTYDPPPSGELRLQDIKPPVSSFTTFAEPPTIHDGTLLVDAGHSNGFRRAEVSAFLSAISERGYSLDFLGEFGLFGNASRLGDSEKVDLLEKKLRAADSFLVIQPADPYSKEETELVHRFVEEKGGKLLLIADPTRVHKINTIAARFGISFRPDYLYNLVDHDLNFQNIFVSDFRPDELTDGLTRIVLYTSGSLESTGGGLAISDSNTRSTMVESVEPLYPMAKSDRAGAGGVLAMADLTFLIPPQNTILDNPRLIANIADFLTTSQRQFGLSDFPHFFTGETDILLGRSSLLDAGTQMKSVLSNFHVASEIQKVEDPTRDSVYLGLYDDAFNVAQYLQLAGIQIDGDLRMPFTPAIASEGTAVAVLHSSGQRQVLVILGDTSDDVTGVLDQLELGGFRDGLVGDFVGVY